MVGGVVVVQARRHPVQAAGLQVGLGGVQGAGGGVGVLRQQPLLAVERPEPAEQFAQLGQGQLAHRAGRTGGRPRGEQPQQVVPGDRAAVVEAVGLAGERLGALAGARLPAGQREHRPPGQLPGVAQTGARELRLDLELAGLGLVVGAVVALVHHGGFPGVQLDARDEVLGAGARVVGDDGRRAAYPGVFLDGQGDLVQLDAVPAELDLVVGPAHAGDRAVGVPAGEVTGAVEALGGDERRRDEALVGQVRPVQVAAGELDAADVELAGGADVDGRALLVEDVALGVVHRHADRDRAGAVVERVRVHQAGGRVDGRLGGPVEVDQRGPGQFVEQCAGQPAGEHLAAGEDALERGARLERAGVQQGLEERGHRL